MTKKNFEKLKEKFAGKDKIFTVIKYNKKGKPVDIKVYIGIKVS